DARQLIHITYGLILNHRDAQDNYVFKDQLYQLWQEYADLYIERLKKHIGRHLEYLYSGFKK
ncbi:MAG: tagaturonate epimerase family protein, partial [Bacilli bacterium]|nr:tagaturonate epimerase family protein [Bacilli bacterium]